MALPGWWQILGYLLLEGAELSWVPAVGDLPDHLLVRARNLMVGRNQEGGILLDTLEVAVVAPGLAAGDFTPGPDLTVQVRKLNLTVSQDYLNDLINLFSTEIAAQVPGLSDVAVTFSTRGVSLSGTLQKGISFGFIIDLGLSVEDNCIRVTWDNFWLANRVPLPGFMRNLLWGYIRSQAKDLGPVTMREQDLLFSPFFDLPLKVDTNLLDISTGDGMLVLMAGKAAGV